MHVFAHVQVHTCVDEHAPLCAYIWRPKVDVGASLFRPPCLLRLGIANTSSFASQLALWIICCAFLVLGL